jgi:hypothetical protein
MPETMPELILFFSFFFGKWSHAVLNQVLKKKKLNDIKWKNVKEV